MASESAGKIAAQAPRPPLDLGRIGIYAVLFAGVLIAIGPFLWMISASFMTLSEVNLTRLLPEKLLWENYATALRRANFLDIEVVTDPATGVLQSLGVSGYIWNSIRITLITVSRLAAGLHPGRLRLRAHELHRAQLHLRALSCRR